MRRLLSFIRRPGAVALLVAAAGFTSSSAWQASDTQLQTFDVRVREYAALHRELAAATAPPMTITSDPYLLFASRFGLAAAVRTARKEAKQGDIFSPAIAAVFRRTIDETLRAHRVDMLALMAEEEVTFAVEVRVNGNYPGGRPVPFMPPCLLDALPPLPPELQYRFAGLDLILWDVDAGLIVDFVPEALRVTS